jgi:hypothetical protein
MNNNEVINISICFEDLKDFMNANPSKFAKAKNGKTYVGMVVKGRKEADKLGNDISVSFSQTKEERAAKAQVVYIGSGKTFTFGESNFSKSSASDLPF